MNVDDWKSQIRRGTLELCILRMISGGPQYGYQIISRLEGCPILAAKESTVYPLLRRLLKEGRLSSFWQDAAEGLPPRKYYSLTPLGREYLDAMWGEWQGLVAAMEGFGGTKGE